MKNSTSHKIAFFGFLIGMLVLTSFKLQASSKIPILTESLVVLNNKDFTPALALATEGKETAVDAPTATSATNIGATSFQANWSAVKDVDGYKLYVYTQGARFPYPKTYVSGFNPKALSGGTTIKSTVSGLNMNTKYYFALKAVEVDGKSTIDSDLSNVISLTTLETVPEAPVATAATAIAASSFTANWEAVQGASSYVLTIGVRRDAANGGGMVSIDGYNKKPLSGLGTSFVIPEGTLESGTEYTYIVYAVNAAGTSSASNWIDVLTVPAPPVVTAATSITNTSFTANWEASTGASSYKLYVLGELDGQPGTYSHITGYNAKEVTGTSLVIPENTLEPGVKHYYHLNAINSSGASSSSGPIYVTTTEPMTYVPDDNFEQALIDLGYDNVLDDYVLTANIDALTSLDVSNKSIADLTGIADFVALTVLKCNDNQLATLNVHSNTALTLLWCDNNQLKDLDLSSNRALTKLNCHTNDFSSLPTLDLSLNTALKSLTCFSSGLTSINLSSNTNLEFLNCYDNALVSLDLSSNTALIKLICSYNELTTLNLKNGNNLNMTGSSSNTGMDARHNANLTCIEVDDATLAGTYPDWEKDATARYSQDCNAPTTYVPDDNFEQALIDLGYDNVLDDYVLTANIDALTSLDVSNKSIADLTGIADFVALTVLKCNDNQLATLNVHSNTALTLLWCDNNQLEDLDLSSNRALTQLNCHTNDFSSLPTLDLSLNTALKRLTCFSSSLTSINLSSNTNLEFLNCSDNALVSLDLSSNTSLIKLICSYNELTTLNLKNGNNLNMTGSLSNTGMDARHNANLICIEVDDATLAGTYPDWEKDATASYSTDCDALAAPEIYGTVQVKDSSFWAEWYAVEDATEYKLTVYSLNQSGDKIYFPEHNPKVITDGTGTYVRGLSQNTTYYWYVQASNADGDSEKSEIETVKTTKSGPEVIQITNITSSSCDVSWSALPGAIEYNLWVYINNGVYFEGFEPKAVTDTHYSVEGLSPNTQYSITVSAVFIDGETEPTDYRIGTIITLRSNMLSLSTSSETGGSVSGGGSFDTSTSVIAQATANDGYVFVNWTEGGVEVSTSATYSFPLNADRTLVANFVASVTTSTLSLSAAPLAGGTVSGGGSVNTGTSVTAQATANTGYEFVNWTEGGTEVSTNASYTFALNDDRTLVANFAVVITTNTLTLSAAPVAGGTVSGAATVNTGTSVTAQATANTGYTFVNWTEGGTEVSTNANYTFALNDDRTLVANFAVVITTNTLSLSAAPVAGGTVSGTATVNTGTSVTAQATANTGYTFVNWTEGGTEVSTNASYTFALNDDRTLVANFAVVITTNTLSLSAAPVAGGSVSGTATVNTGTSVTAQATVNDGYVFVNWTEGGTEVSANASYTFTLNDDRTLVANFQLATGIDDKNITSIAVWPNPVSAILNISEIPFGSSLKVTSLLGQVVIQKNDCNQQESLNVESLKNGIYILIIENKQMPYSQKFIKR